ncbi:MAG TPA: glutamyl-tRNA reductase [Thermoanaerobaculia bacterium]|nr:glutamyl-tRNA reductase [Thermoanaerobaculia bacterium]
MNLVFVGWNHRGAPLDLRERLAFTPEKAREALRGLFEERILAEGAIVSTCNRAEIYGVSDREDDLDALSGFFSRFHRVDDVLLRQTALTGHGDATVRHLFRVAAGLDSMVLGEAQILGQIREAHRVATAAGSLRAVTNRLFMNALECGKRVRAETGLGTRPTSVAGLALTLAGRIFESLKGRRALLVGAGETAELTARLLLDEGVSEIVVTNRSLDRAQALAAASGGRAVPWDQRAAAAAEADLILSATNATEPVLTAAALKTALSRAKRRGPLLVLDLAVPRDVEVEVGELADVYRYDIEALTGMADANAKARLEEVPRAEAIVEECVGRFADWWGSLLQVDVVRGLREKIEGIRLAEIEKYAGKLSGLSEKDRATVERLTETLVGRILHEPTVGLKEGGASERLEKAASVRSLFRLDDPPR